MGGWVACKYFAEIFSGLEEYKVGSHFATPTRNLCHSVTTETPSLRTTPTAPGLPDSTPAECEVHSRGQCEKDMETRWFRIFKCGIHEIPKNIPANANTVNLEFNCFSSVPAGIFTHLTSCKKLYLNWNQISKVADGAFEGMVSLLELEIGHNLLSSVPVAALTGLHTLLSLDISDNRIQTLVYDQFHYVFQLQQLSLRNNLISKIELGAWRSLMSLTFLRMNQNLLTVLHSYIFTGLTKLNTLELTNNQIFHIEADAFFGLDELTELKLFSNQISVLDQRAFFGLWSLENLHLWNNNLTFLDQSLLFDIPRPLRIGLSAPFAPSNLDCSSLCWLRQEELDGTIRWFPNFGPVCSLGVTWENLTCINYQGMTHPLYDDLFQNRTALKTYNFPPTMHTVCEIGLCELLCSFPQSGARRQGAYLGP